MRPETLKGHLDGTLPTTLEPGPRHGYAIMEALRAGSGGRFGLPTGTVYPALRRPERAGLVAGTWSEAGGRRRRVYQLTPAGRRTPDTERGTWRDFPGAVTALPGPARARARASIIAELRAGLLDATDAYRAAGLPAARTALA